MKLLEARISGDERFYGNVWPVLDIYFYWFYTTVEDGGFAFDPCPETLHHTTVCEKYPSLQAAFAREQRHSSNLEKAIGTNI